MEHFRGRRLGPGGGIVDTPANTPEGHAVDLRNAFYRAGSWWWRTGAVKMHATPYTEQLAGAWTFKSTGPGTPAWDLMAATRGSATAKAHFARLIGAGLVALPWNGTPGPDYDADNAWRAWRWAAVNDTTAYACRRTWKGGLLYHVTRNAATEARIPPPTAAPTVVDGGPGGALPAGTYRSAYRYRTSDGMYSPWSPATSTAIAATGRRTWTFAASTHPRVTTVELGSSYPDAQDVFVAASVAHTLGTYTEDVVGTSLDITRRMDVTLAMPPDDPEDALVWRELLWVASNNPSPAVWRCSLEGGRTPIYSTFNPLQALRMSGSSAQRIMALRAVDNDLMAVLTDGAAYAVDRYFTPRVIENSSGCVSAAACDTGAGFIAWYDGRDFVVSQGGAPAQIVSRGRVSAALSAVPATHAERAVMLYVPEDSGSFVLCVPQSAGEPALAVAWRPSDGQAHLLNWLGGAHAPAFLSRAAAESSGYATLACFATSSRVFRLDAWTRRDEGPTNIPVTIETAAVPLPSNAASVAVSAVHVGVRRRPDTGLGDTGATLSCDVSLRINDGTPTTPVTATLTPGKEYLHARFRHDPAASVQVVLEFDHPELLEVFDVSVDGVYYERQEVPL